VKNLAAKNAKKRKFNLFFALFASFAAKTLDYMPQQNYSESNAEV